MWAARTSRPIPNVGSRSTTIGANDYSLGMNSFLGNDKFPFKNGASNMWRLAQNARIITLGDYDTRKGFDFHSEAAGVTQDQAQTSTTGAADKSVSNVTRYAQKLTTTSAGRCTRVDIRIENVASATGTMMIELWSNSGGVPGTMLARSSIAASSITGSYAYVTARFAEAPTVTSSTDYWIVIYVQSTGTNSYSVSSTTSATNALVSTNSGTSWSATSYALNFKQYYATSGAVLGLYRAYKSDGTSKTLFVQGTTLYAVDDITGALTTVKSGLSANATRYRFETANDKVYYVNGYDGYRKWDFTTESQVSATNYTTLCLHKGVMFLVRSDDPNRVDFSNFGDYETFTSTDFYEVPAPKTGDPVTALVSLNGYLLNFTRKNKFILSGEDDATFDLEEAPDQHGTFTQETVTKDDNFVYYLASDGVYRSNGSEPHLMSEGNYKDVLTIASKEETCVAINKGRLYLWYRSSGAAANDSCYVWNTNYGSGESDCLESNDTDAFVTRAITAFRDSDKLIVGSSLVGQVFYQELDSNDYSNLGGDIDFMLQTHYMTYDNPASLKEVRYWNPRFGAQSGNYTILSEYATDLRDNWTTQGTTNVQGSGYVWGSAATVWGSFVWGATAEVQAQLYVPGEYRRIALRYKHFATRQPQRFLGHTQTIQLRRMR